MIYHVNIQTHKTPVNTDNKGHILDEVVVVKTNTSLILYHY